MAGRVQYSTEQRCQPPLPHFPLRSQSPWGMQCGRGCRVVHLQPTASSTTPLLPAWFAWHGSAVLHSAFGSGRALCAVWCVRACGSPGHHMQISTTPPLSESVCRRDPQVGTPNLLCCRSYTSKGSCSAQK